MDVGGLQESEESPPWMIQLFEQLDLEVDEENLCSTDKMTKNDANSIDKDDNSRKLGIGSSNKERPECKHPAVCALILPRKDEEKREEYTTDPDDYLTGCHTHNTTGTCFGSSTCPWSNRTLPAPHSRPLIGARYLLSDEEAKEYYRTKKRLTYRRRPQIGMEPMIEECLLAFRNYVKNNSLEDTEHRFGELVYHCATVHVEDKIYQHFNFIIETKLMNSDIWTPKLYFAEVKELSSGKKYYFCCPLEASDSGDCYQCERQQLVDGLQHPDSGGYEDGYSTDYDICIGYSSSDSYSDKDEDKLPLSVWEDHWLMYVN